MVYCLDYIFFILIKKYCFGSGYSLFKCQNCLILCYVKWMMQFYIVIMDGQMDKWIELENKDRDIQIDYMYIFSFKCIL